MKRLIIFTTFACFILSISLVAAQVEITVKPANLTVELGLKAEYQITIKNNQLVADSFIIFVSGSHLEWSNLDTYYVELNPNSERTIRLWFYPTNEEGLFSYEIFVVSHENPEVKSSTRIYLNIISPEKPEVKLDILDFGVEKIGDELTANLAMQSTEKTYVWIDFEVKDEKGKVVNSTQIYAEVEGKKNVSTKFYLKEWLAGSYSVQVGVRETNLTRQASFKIETVHKVTKSEKVVSSPLFTLITFSVNNLGNVIEYNYSFSETLPEAFITFITPPSSRYDQTCEWVIDKLEPGQSIEISYRIEHWLIWFKWIIIGVVIICVIIFLGLKLTRPVVKKKYMKGKKGRYTIILELKNPWIHKITEVVVVDSVTPLARVYKKFETVKPVMKATKEGTELTWKLGIIHPREERILHYEIKPIVHGSLKMPEACLRFKTEKDKKVKVYSKELILEV